jgi:NTE family protein
VLIDGEKLLDMLWPTQVPDRFEQLAIPFTAVTTDFHGRREALFETGPLAPAVAGSMAIAGLMKPVSADGMYLVDGGVINPLPYRALIGRAAVIIACDVTAGPIGTEATSPKPFEAMIGSAQILQGAITNEMLKTDAPDILLVPQVQTFRTLDFFRAAKILEAAEHLREDVKRALAEKLERA